MSESDGIEVRIGSYANLIVQPSAYIDCSHMTDEEFAAMQAETEHPGECTCGACACSMCGSNAMTCDGQCTAQYEEPSE